ncbi:MULTISPECIES: azurin [Pseudomonas]|uniref:Azurin n=1 Tax=Pseudomonas eucalypticola TaxID=2599595 RepID=A0A7D5H5B7_9PSED|nr:MULTISPECIES: azurin [Pseudomonas]QKZ04409.1 azurin [Pseudomonas eucalypticola]
MLRTAAALAALTLSGFAFADTQCSVTIHGTDQMTYDLKTIAVPASCKQFQVTLEHPGTLPKNVMGHNWVLSKKDDLKGVTDDGSKAGESNDYVQPGDARVLAHTKLIGGGEKATVTLDTKKLKKGDDYVFFCSYPFHATMMKGTLTFSG